MTAGIYNFVIEQGADFSKTLTIKDADNNNINLTSYSFSSHAKADFSDPSPVFRFSFSISNQGTNPGEVVMSLARSVSTSVKVSKDTKYYYDIEMTDGSDVKSRLLSGYITLRPEVTK